MSFPVYPKYAKSSIDWLELLPSHWESSRLKNLFQLMKRPPRDDDEIVTAFRDGEVTLRSKRRIDGYTNAIHEHGYQGIRTGDLVIHAMDAFAGAIGVSDSDGKSTPVYSVCTPKLASTHAAYYARLMRHMALSGFVNSLAKGIRERSTEFRWNEAGNVVLPVPPTSEQEGICRFLDRETSKIDALVAEQQRLIELLKEKRQAVISHAVTKGLNPDVQMKPSGIEWIGDVPEHWSVGALRYFAQFCTGSTPDRSNPAYWEGGIPWVKTGEVNYSLITETEETISQEGLNSSACSIAPAGTLLMALYGQGVTRGRVATLGLPAAFNQACVAISVDKRLLNDFLHAFFVFAYSFIRDGNETTQMNMNVEFVRRVRVVVPPIQEQRAIAEHVNQSGQKILDLIAEAEHAIGLLLERRTAVISAAVTGKIDVRALVSAEVV